MMMMIIIIIIIITSGNYRKKDTCVKYTAEECDILLVKLSSGRQFQIRATAAENTGLSSVTSPA